MRVRSGLDSLRVALAALVCLILFGFVQAAARADEAGERPFGAASSPLERLKLRSPDQRLQKLNDQWNSVKPPADAVPPGSQANAPSGASWKTTPKTREISAPADARAFEPSNPKPVPRPGPFYEETPGDSAYEEIAIDPQPPAGGAAAPGPADQFPWSQLDPQTAARQPIDPHADRMQTAPARGPAHLRRVTEILPFHDYEPDARPGEEIVGLDELLPDEIELEDGVYPGRFFPESVFAWEASNVWYNPLYFEDVQLERYGHTHHPLIQPFASVGRFGVQLLGLPYQMTINPVCKMIYPLGFYRPGECAPDLYYQIPINGNAAFVTAGVYTGLFYLIP